MIKEYAALPARILKSKTTFHRPAYGAAPAVGLEDPAAKVMTDLKQVTAFTIDPEVSIETAHRVMSRRGVHLLLVVDVDNNVLGIITSTDIMGEKPMQVIQARGVMRSEVLVRDIMTSQDRLEVISMDDVLHARVGHVVAYLKRTGRQHAAVVDEDGAGNQILRGLFAASQVYRQLGLPPQSVQVAQTFAEIEYALNH